MSMFYDAPPITFKNAKNLRKILTKAEEILWEHLSKNQLKNFRFRRQHPIGKFIVDFYCHKAKLVVEIDGPYHYRTDQIHYDVSRTEELNLHGLRVIRFSNDQVEHHLNEVLNEIIKYLN